MLSYANSPNNQDDILALRSFSILLAKKARDRINDTCSVFEGDINV